MNSEVNGKVIDLYAKRDGVNHSPKITEILMNAIKWFPWLLPKIIKKTHGEVMTIE